MANIAVHTGCMNDLVLPQQFALLLHLPHGSVYLSADYTGAAELGELAMRGEIEIEGKKARLIERKPDSPDWVREVLDVVERQAGPKGKPVDIGNLQFARRNAVKTHRAALLERGLLEHKPRKRLGVFPDNRYVPDETARGELLQAVRDAAAQRRELDERLAPLCALVAASGLAYGLGLNRAERNALKTVASEENVGEAVEQGISAATTAALIAVNTAVVTTVLSNQ